MPRASLRIGDEDRIEIEPMARKEGVAWTVRLVLVQRQEMRAVVNGAYLIPEAREAYRLTEFFEELASMHWTGWSGTRSWASLEHNLSIEASWHRTGGATLRITLASEGQRWESRGTIEVEDMALEQLGAKARSVLLG